MGHSKNPLRGRGNRGLIKKKMALSRSCFIHTTSLLTRSTPLPLPLRINMFSIKTLVLAAAIVGATAFAPVSRSMSAPELRVAAPRICTRGRALTRSMSGDGSTTLAMPPSGATETLLREKLTTCVESFDADTSATINLDTLKMAASIVERRRPLSAVLLMQWIQLEVRLRSWLQVYPDASFSGALFR
ncbi:hypothetical protein T484DRAFT_1745836 [Baffinella frigidus]|nr:hypothetical protein T484DRAFT_1745836 [Cryptophyta sp. CCMP2293]